jgi:isoleucyl-tRNA synthetase
VSQVAWVDAPGAGAQPLSAASIFGNAQLHAEVLRADGEKCPRCWQYSAKVGAGQDVCDRCADALR